MHSLKPWEAAGTSGGGACVLDARIIDGTGGDPIERGYITIVNGRVARVGTMAKLDIEVGRDLERFDVEGRTIIPGLIDAHAHLVYGGYRRFDELNSVGPETAAIHAAANAWTVL
jgi:imidazolonepropionase-like amidohydrolase